MSAEARSNRPQPKEAGRINLGRQIINFSGPEGSGKTTVGRMFADASGKPLVTTSDILKDFAANDNTALGDECRAMFAEHRYMNTEVLFDIYRKSFKKDSLKLKEGFILDGGLRSTEETEAFSSILEEAGIENMPITLIHLRVPGWLGVNRLIGESGRKRDDDTVEGVLSRLSRYYDHLGQRTSLAQKQEGWRILRVDATGNIEQTFDNVRKVLME